MKTLIKTPQEQIEVISVASATKRKSSPLLLCFMDISWKTWIKPSVNMALLCLSGQFSVFIFPGLSEALDSNNHWFLEAFCFLKHSLSWALVAQHEPSFSPAFLASHSLCPSLEQPPLSWLNAGALWDLTLEPLVFPFCFFFLLRWSHPSTWFQLPIRNDHRFYIYQISPLGCTWMSQRPFKCTVSKTKLASPNLVFIVFSISAYNRWYKSCV